MKKQLLSVLAASSVLTGFAQLPVSTSVQHKKAVLEEFTGVYCGYCPDGHAKENAIYNADPSNVVLINIHSGPFAYVNVGEPDMMTPEGTAIDGMTGTSVNSVSIPMGIQGYPAGDMNRRVFSSGSQTVGAMAGNRTAWMGWATTVKTETAYCNVALQGTIDVSTRMLTVVAQVYYTDNSPSPTNYLNVFLLEDSITGPQHNYGAATYGPAYWNFSNYNQDSTYNHNHVLRHALTGNFGDAVNSTTTGAMYTTTLTYAIPLSYGAVGKTTPCQLGHLRLAAFVTETDVNTINGAHGAITLTNIPNTTDIATNSLSFESTYCANQQINPKFKFMNNGSAAVTAAVLSYSINGSASGTYNWTGAVNPQTSSQTIYLPTTSFTPVTTGNNTVMVSVVSVNGGSDQNTSNDATSKPLPPPPTAPDIDHMKMVFKQDQYGDEDSWAVYDENTGDSLAYDGPFNQLSSPGTAVHTVTFTVDPFTCYTLLVRDRYGDGVNGGYGVGGYTLTSGTTTLKNSNGVYGLYDVSLFRSAATMTYTGIQSVKATVRSVNVYPNPASDATNLSIQLTQNENIGVSVTNSMGQEVYAIQPKSMDAGNNMVTLNTQSWAAGVYFIRVSSPKGSLNQKLTVTK